MHPESPRPARGALHFPLCPLAGICARAGVSLPALAIGWAVKHEGIATTLVGMCASEQVDANVQIVLRALGVEENPNAEAEENAMCALEEAFRPLQGQTWPSGRPENH